MSVIFPVFREMTIVAASSSPEIMARVETRTVMGGSCKVSTVLPVGGDGSGMVREMLEAISECMAKQSSFHSALCHWQGLQHQEMMIKPVLTEVRRL